MTNNLNLNLDTGFRLGILKNGTAVVGKIDINNPEKDALITECLSIIFDMPTGQIGMIPLAYPYSSKLPDLFDCDFLMLLKESEIDNGSQIKDMYEDRVNKLKHPGLIIPNIGGNKNEIKL
jgi:hypothetical protein